MALVTWGVWHTLTHTHSGSEASEEPAPKWDRDSSSRGKSGNGPRAASSEPARHETARNDTASPDAGQQRTFDSAPRNGASHVCPGNAVIEPYYPDAPLLSSNTGARDSTQPR